jgi:hypothetical protein
MLTCQQTAAAAAAAARWQPITHRTTFEMKECITLLARLLLLPPLVLLV